MENGTYYRRILRECRYINDLPDEVLDHLLFGRETRPGVIKAELFYLRNELKKADPYLAHFIEQIIEDKKTLHSILLILKH